jgi:hypothetical protein
MWFRLIDGNMLVSEDCAKRLKEACIPGTQFIANEQSFTLGKNMDLERTGDDDRFWFYTEDEKHALQINILNSEDTYEIILLERKMYWFGELREKSIPLTSFSFQSAEIVIEEKKGETKSDEISNGIMK